MYLNLCSISIVYGTKSTKYPLLAKMISYNVYENHIYDISIKLWFNLACTAIQQIFWALFKTLFTSLYGRQREKTCLWEFANNTGANQPAHQRSQISAFVILFLESIICKLATGEISIF